MWILPSRKRPERLQEAIESFEECGLSTPGVVLVDELDDSAYEAVRLPRGWLMERIPSTCSADCHRYAFKKWPDLEWYGVLSDDCQAKTQGFDVELIKSAGSKGFAHANDLRKSPRRIGPCAVFGGELVRAMGGLVPEGFKHRYVDDVWENLGRDLNLWTVRMDVVVEHLHPYFGKAQMDETYLKAYSYDDQGVYEVWKNTQKPAMYDSVRAIL